MSNLMHIPFEFEDSGTQIIHYTPENYKSQRDLGLSGVRDDKGLLIAEHLQGALPAISVVDHIALSSANLNDMDPMLGFAQQVFGYGRKQDVFWESLLPVTRRIYYQHVPWHTQWG